MPAGSFRRTQHHRSDFQLWQDSGGYRDGGRAAIAGGVAIPTDGLQALQEVRDAMAKYSHENERKVELEQMVVTSQRKLNFARQMFNGGVQEYAPVLDAEEILVAAKAQLADSRENCAEDLVSLYGRWAADGINGDSHVDSSVEHVLDVCARRCSRVWRRCIDGRWVCDPNDTVKSLVFGVQGE